MALVRIPRIIVEDATFLNDVVINNSTLNVYGSTTLTINTYLELFDTNITIGNDPVSPEYIKLNDQVDLNGTSSVILANNLTTVDAIDLGAQVLLRDHMMIFLILVPKAPDFSRLFLPMLMDMIIPGL